MLRCTRLASLVSTTDPKLAATVFSMNAEGVMIYLADHVDTARLPERWPAQSDCPATWRAKRRGGLAQGTSLSSSSA